MLPLVISSTQIGYVTGRHIEENILLAQEMVGNINMKRRERNVILKLDIEKAYDRLN